MEIKCGRCNGDVGEREVVFNRHVDEIEVERFVCFHCLEEELAKRETAINDLKELIAAIKQNLRAREADRSKGGWLC